MLDNLDVTIGYAYSDVGRRSSSRGIQVLVGCGPICDSLPGEAASLTIEAPGPQEAGRHHQRRNPGPEFNVRLNERTPFPVFDAALEVHAGYGQLRWSAVDAVTIEVGARCEDAVQAVALDQSIFTTPIPGATPTNIANDYFLPAATITWELMDDLRSCAIAASETIARHAVPRAGRTAVFRSGIEPAASSATRCCRTAS